MNPRAYLHRRTPRLRAATSQAVAAPLLLLLFRSTPRGSDEDGEGDETEGAEEEEEEDGEEGAQEEDAGLADEFARELAELTGGQVRAPPGFCWGRQVRARVA